MPASRLAPQFYASLVLAALIALPLVALLPASGTLFAERDFAAALERQVAAGVFRSATDAEIRRSVQKLGREQGFQLATGDVTIVASDPLTTELVHLRSVGYTLPVRLPLLWLFDFEVVVVRQFSVIR